MSLTSKQRTILIAVAAALVAVVAFCVAYLVRKSIRQNTPPETVEELIEKHLEATDNTRNFTATYEFQLSGEDHYKQFGGIMYSMGSGAYIELIIDEVDSDGGLLSGSYNRYYVNGIYTYKQDATTEEWEQIETPEYLDLMATYMFSVTDFDYSVFTSGETENGVRYSVMQYVGDSVVFDIASALAWVSVAKLDDGNMPGLLWVFDENYNLVSAMTDGIELEDAAGNTFELTGYINFTNVGKLPDELEEELVGVPAEAFE